jgi:hypothetical protein
MNMMHGNLYTYLLMVGFMSLLSETPLFSQNVVRLDAPELFIKLDSTCATPDAMAFDEAGNIYLSVTNATTYGRFGAKIIKLSAAGQILNTWAALPAHPVTGKVHPMGMAIASDGFLYLADNQSFAGGKHSSRVLRAKVQDGSLQKFEVVVDGLNVANGLRFDGGYVYVTDAWTDNNRMSGLFRFDIKHLGKQAIHVDAKNRSKYLVHEWELDPGTEPGVGVDGLDFDTQGNLYVGNFSGGTITKITFKQGSSKPLVTAIAKDKALIGCDGIFFDKSSNALLIANFLENSILQYALTTNRLTQLWKNGDAACTADLDCPCDLAIVNERLVVVNFDTYTTNANKTVDSCNTISVLKIRRSE